MEPGSAAGVGPSLPHWALVSPKRREHIERVAELAGRWASAMGTSDTERRRWLRAVWLHDALRDAPEAELRKWAPDARGPLELRHGPASAARAKAEGETDRGVLMICDPRLLSRSYGKRVLASLPPMKVTREVREAVAFFTRRAMTRPSARPAKAPPATRR